MDFFSEAVKNGNISRVKLFLSKQVKIDAKDSVGRTPLYHACENGYIEIVELLLKHKADPNAKTKVVIHLLCIPRLIPVTVFPRSVLHIYSFLWVELCSFKSIRYAIHTIHRGIQLRTNRL
eukprot:TRINITY_DN880_c0_g1_i14.p1 TRINITY_DN880_c0_g1~~TRINITY_DN880_c0_g1_i14.p1  ORF type:complete len:121 (+),score=13.74 TRINITY_DN880_c0_g1_i14:561-923(+)